MPIRRLYVENFRSYAGPQWLDLAPLTIVVGENGSGKSAVLDALEVLIETASTYDRTGFLVPPHLEWLLTDHAIHHRCDTGQTLGLGLAFDMRVDGPTVEESSFVARFDRDVQARSDNKLYQGRWRYEAIARDAPVTWDTGALGTNVGRGLRLGNGPAIPHMPMPNRPFDDMRNVGPFDASLSPHQHESIARGLRTIDATRGLLTNGCSVLRYPRSVALMDAIIGDTTGKIGVFGELTLRVLSQLYSTVSQRQKRKKLEQWSRQFGLGELTAGWGAGRELRAQFVDPFTFVGLPLAAAGGGSQQLLPFLVQAVGASEGQVIAVDEIEHGLHPGHLSMLAEVLAECVDGEFGHQLIVTTQSPTLLLALCALVGEGKLARDKIGILAVTRDDTGSSKTRTLAVQADGSVEGGWLEHYAEAERSLFRRLWSVGTSPKSEADGGEE